MTASADVPDEACETEAGVAGVTVGSVVRELEWRAHGSGVDKAKRLFSYNLNGL